jgi:uncharacterized membrane protein HdeD (DUF308 family)
MIIIQLCYLLISVAVTVWVARTLHRNGRLFLVEAFHGHEQMADSVNHLLVVGFYLINIGFVALFLRYGERPDNAIDGLEYISTKIGVVLVVLGIMHFFNIFNFAKMRAKGRRQPAPAVAPRDEAFRVRQ